jgi:class 3 adenylate cyclase
MQESIVEQVKRLWKQWQPATGLNVYMSSFAQSVRGRLRTASPAAPLRDSGQDVERRPLSVLFCDLVGSTPLSRRLDPEDLRDVLTKYHSVVREEISAQGGYTAQLLGDGVLAYFGWPVAHEDDPVRAVRSGLAILRACSELSSRVRDQLGDELEVRVGIHSGTVVLGEMGERGRSEFLAVGEVPNIASKAQSAAHAQSLVVTETTRRLTQGQFQFTAMNTHSVQFPFELYVVASETPARNRLDWSGSLTTFVNRNSEMTELQAAWNAASAGRSVAVLVSGEPGSGKSRLVREFCSRATAAEILECTCLARLQNSPFYPLVDLLERQIGIHRQKPPEYRLERLRAWSTQSTHSSAQTLQVLHSLLGLHDEAALAETSAIRQRRTTLDTLFTLFFRERSVTTVLVVEGSRRHLGAAHSAQGRQTACSGAAERHGTECESAERRTLRHHDRGTHTRAAPATRAAPVPGRAIGRRAAVY